MLRELNRVRAASTCRRSSPSSEAHDMVRLPTHRVVLLSGGFTRVGIGGALAALPAGHPTALYTIHFAG
jgi:hypothetical protein